MIHTCFRVTQNPRNAIRGFVAFHWHASGTSNTNPNTPPGSPKSANRQLSKSLLLLADRTRRIDRPNIFSCQLWRVHHSTVSEKGGLANVG
jgi:hypothetical protein